MKKYLPYIGAVLAIIFIVWVAINAQRWVLEARFAVTSYVMNTRIAEVNSAIDALEESIGGHEKSICYIATYKLKKLVPGTDEKLKAKVINNCEVIPAFVERGWGFEFLDSLPAHDDTTRDDPPTPEPLES